MSNTTQAAPLSELLSNDPLLAELMRDVYDVLKQRAREAQHAPAQPGRLNQPAQPTRTEEGSAE